MGRNRTFDEAAVLDTAAAVFCRGGYDGTGIDELLGAVGLHRGSLYKAFGSKLGLFVAVLERVAPSAGTPSPYDDATALDLLLVASLDLAPRDAHVRDIVQRSLAARSISADHLGARLLIRAGLSPSPTGELA